MNVCVLQLSPVLFHVFAQSSSVMHSRVQYLVLSVVLRRAQVPVHAQSAPEPHVLYAASGHAPVPGPPGPPESGVASSLHELKLIVDSASLAGGHVVVSDLQEH